MRRANISHQQGVLLDDVKPMDAVTADPLGCSIHAGLSAKDDISQTAWFLVLLTTATSA